MSVVCPKCNESIELDPARIQDGHLINCSKCQTVLKLSLGVTLHAEPSGGGTGASKLDPKKVLTVVEGEATKEMIREVLATGDYHVIEIDNPEGIVEALEKEKPGIVIVDVGLPKIVGFQIAETIRKRSTVSDVGVILLASIHNRKRYKREPESLYGADDYIERHRIQDTLLSKITNILNARTSPGQEEKPESAPSPEAPAPEKAPIQPEKAKALEEAMSVESVFESMLAEEKISELTKEPSKETLKAAANAAMTEKPGPVLKGEPAAHEAAKRLARIIVSDIALYNQRTIEEGIQKGTFHDLLKEDLAEGKKLYEGRVPDEIRSGTNYLEDAIEDFTSKKKAEFERRI